MCLSVDRQRTKLSCWPDVSSWLGMLGFITSWCCGWIIKKLKLVYFAESKRITLLFRSLWAHRSRIPVWSSSWCIPWSSNGVWSHVRPNLAKERWLSMTRIWSLRLSSSSDRLKPIPWSSPDSGANSSKSANPFNSPDSQARKLLPWPFAAARLAVPDPPALGDVRRLYAPLFTRFCMRFVTDIVVLTLDGWGRHNRVQTQNHTSTQHRVLQRNQYLSESRCY